MGEEEEGKGRGENQKRFGDVGGDMGGDMGRDRGNRMAEALKRVRAHWYGLSGTPTFGLLRGFRGLAWERALHVHGVPQESHRPMTLRRYEPAIAGIRLPGAFVFF